MVFAAIIPARYASTRFPAKPLAVLGGKPVIIRVCEQAGKVFDNVFVATDDVRIFDVVKDYGFTPIMTRSDHKSGTDRCYEAYVKCGVKADVVVNIQGDEPFIQPSQLQTIKSLFEIDDTDIATLVKPFAPDTTFEMITGMHSISAAVSYLTSEGYPRMNGLPDIYTISISDCMHSEPRFLKLLRDCLRLLWRRPKVWSSCVGYLPVIVSK